MFYVYERELLGELMLNCPKKITLPKSISNQFGNVFVSNGTGICSILIKEGVQA